MESAVWDLSYNWHHSSRSSPLASLAAMAFANLCRGGDEWQHAGSSTKSIQSSGRRETALR
jgi:hypothetical protein